MSVCEREIEERELILIISRCGITVHTSDFLLLLQLGVAVSSPSQRQRSSGEHFPMHATHHHQSRNQRGQGSSSKCQRTRRDPNKS